MVECEQSAVKQETALNNLCICPSWTLRKQDISPSRCRQNCGCYLDAFITGYELDVVNSNALPLSEL